MKVFSNEETFNYSWEEVSTANWRKYCPWNDKSTHVIAVDTLSRHVDTATGIVRIAPFPIFQFYLTLLVQLRTERLITCKQSAPKWLASLMGGTDVSQVFETSYVDPESKKVTMISHNLTFSNIINVRETVVYQPLSATRTAFKQEAQITALCGGWQKVKSAVEDATVTRFRENAIKGKEGFEAVLEMSRRVFSEEKLRQSEIAEKLAA
jgi:PRELI-like family